MMKDIKFWLTFVVVLLVFEFFIKTTDDTDHSRFKRSGMSLHVDYGTGCEYLAGGGFFGKSRLIPRLNAKGKHVCK
jgi:hypothetical protein